MKASDRENLMLCGTCEKVHLRRVSAADSALSCPFDSHVLCFIASDFPVSYIPVYTFKNKLCLLSKMNEHTHADSSH